MTDAHFGDPTTAEFWAGAAAGELRIQHCGACGRWQHYPRPFCMQCYADDVRAEPVSGTGTVYSRTTIRFGSAPPGVELPFSIGIVELDEGVRLLTHLVGERTEIDDRVRVAWRDRDDAPPLPIFLAEGADHGTA